MHVDLLLEYLEYLIFLPFFTTLQKESRFVTSDVSFCIFLFLKLKSLFKLVQASSFFPVIN